jgi:SAM-dependent methyltransferase
MTSQSDLGRAGFSHAADVYERGRPTYTAESFRKIVDALNIGFGRRILDLAAGTGKFTRLLRATGADVVAVEPSTAMRAELARILPDVDCRDGKAESIPLPDQSVDAVTVAQAFHWFDPAQALPEIARVLRPGGGLSLIWNERDESVPWVAEMSRVIRWDTKRPFGLSTDFAAVLNASGLFTPTEVTRLHWNDEIDRETFSARIASVSYIALLSPTERHQIIDEALRLIANFPERFSMPYVTDIYICRTPHPSDNRLI